MPRPLNPIFTVEYQYQKFLAGMNLNEATMPEQQKIYMRQAFFGGFSQLLYLQRDETPELSTDEVIGMYEKMIEEIGDFWDKDQKRIKDSKKIKPKL
jgi:hypothetical protein